MTEKRFIAIDSGLDFMVRDTVTGDGLLDADGVADVLNDYEKENEQLKQELFETRKDYIIETADISDKLYLDEFIEEARKEIFE